MEMGLYRIAQEAIQNVLKHAGASLLLLQLQLKEKTVSLSIKDNGRGFNEEEIDSQGFGLIGLKERARLLKGQLKVSSEKDKGTTIRVVVEI